jgi:hypothetical protein
MFARSGTRINDPHARRLPKIDPAFGKSTLFLLRDDQERHVPARGRPGLAGPCCRDPVVDLRSRRSS